MELLKLRQYRKLLLFENANNFFEVEFWIGVEDGECKKFGKSYKYQLKRPQRGRRNNGGTLARGCRRSPLPLHLATPTKVLVYHHLNRRRSHLNPSSEIYDTNFYFDQTFENIFKSVFLRFVILPLPKILQFSPI